MKIRQRHVHHPHQPRLGDLPFRVLVVLLQVLRSAVRTYGDDQPAARFQLIDEFLGRLGGGRTHVDAVVRGVILAALPAIALCVERETVLKFKP